MIPVTVVDVNYNGTISAMLQDGEIYDNIPVSQPVELGERIMMSPEQITSGYELGSDAYNPEEDNEKPSFDFDDFE